MINQKLITQCCKWRSNAGLPHAIRKKQKNTISLGGSLGYASLFSDPNKYKSEATILGIADPDKRALPT